MASGKAARPAYTRWLSHWAKLWLATLVALAFVAPTLVPHRYDVANATTQLQAPNNVHWLGTDALGRDVLARLAWGSQRSLLMMGLAALVAVGLGTALAMLSLLRYGAGLAWLMQVGLALPPILTSLIFLALLGRGWAIMGLAAGGAQLFAYAQVMRSALRQVYAEGYIEAARALGASEWRLLWRHSLPNVVLVWAGYSIATLAYVLLSSSALSFLGFGEPGVPDWGVMLAEGRSAFRLAPWVALAPGFVVTMSVAALNQLANDIIPR